MTREQTKQLVFLITKAFPRFTIVSDKEGMDLWHECLSDMDFDKARKCVIESIKSSEFPPTIAEIRKAYEVVVADDKKQESAIREFYNQARSYYPGSGEYGYGWEEWMERLNDDPPETRVEASRWLCNRLIKYVNSCDKETMDFAEAIRTV